MFMHGATYSLTPLKHTDDDGLGRAPGAIAAGQQIVANPSDHLRQCVRGERDDGEEICLLPQLAVMPTNSDYLHMQHRILLHALVVVPLVVILQDGNVELLKLSVVLRIVSA